MTQGRAFRFISLLVLGIYTVALVAYATRRGPELPWEEHIWDKARHAGAFFVMAALALFSIGFPKFSSKKCAVKGLWAVGYSTAVGAGIEIAQMYVPGRDAESADLVADFVGAAAALILAVAWLRRKERLTRSTALAAG